MCVRGVSGLDGRTQRDEQSNHILLRYNTIYVYNILYRGPRRSTSLQHTYTYYIPITMYNIYIKLLLAAAASAVLMMMCCCCCSVPRYEYYNIREYYYTSAEGLARHQRNFPACVFNNIFADDVENCEFAMQYNNYYNIVERIYTRVYSVLSSV